MGDRYFVERRQPDGPWEVKAGGAFYPTSTHSTQEEAVDWIEKNFPNAEIHVERRYNEGPGPDKWRRWK